MTRLRSSNRDLTHWIVMLTVGAAVYLIGCHFARAAGPADATASTPGVDWNFWIAIASAVGTATVYILHRVAAKTHSAKLETVAKDVDWMLGLIPKQAPVLAVAPEPRDKQAGFTTVLNMIAIALVGLVIGVSVWACTADQAKHGATAGAVAFLDCESAHLDQQALADVKALASAEIRHLIEGGAAPTTDALKADMAPIVSDLGRCGWAAAVAAYGAVVAPAAGTAVRALVAGPDPAQVRAAFATAARQLGWQPVRIAGGDVL